MMTMGSTAPLPDHASPWTTTRRTPAHQRPARRPHKSSVPSPLPWKDALKQGCLERARRKRQETIWRNRRLDSPSSDQETARQLVEDELRESGVAIHVRAALTEIAETSTCTDSAMVHSEAIMSERTTEGVEDDYAISESELYKLMQEVEEELQRDGKFMSVSTVMVCIMNCKSLTGRDALLAYVEAMLNEEMEEVELCEHLRRQHMEDQIAEFQDWEAEQDQTNQVVLCPLCQEANLMQLSENGVTCPNHMNGACPLRLERTEETILLPNLRERLGTAYEKHACECTGPLQFQILQKREDDERTLVASCNMCNSNVTIL